MENDLSEQLTRMLLEHLRGNPAPPQSTTLDRHLDTIYDLFQGYNGIIEQYQRNIGDLITTLQSLQNMSLRTSNMNNRPRVAATIPRQTQPPAAAPVPTATRVPAPAPATQPPSNTTADLQLLLTYLFQPPANSTEPLTREAISAATRTYGYTAEMITPDASGNLCPISLEPFQVGDVICEIRGCHHIFRRPALMAWFRRNPRCPVCRYNLSDYRSNGGQNGGQNTITINANTIPQHPVGDTGSLTTTPGTFSDISGARIFEFEIPLDTAYFQNLSRLMSSSTTQSDENDSDSDSDIEADLSVD